MRLRHFILLPSLLYSATSPAEPLSGTLPVLQMNPVMMRYFDPSPESAKVEPAGRTTLRIDQHYTSIFLADRLPTPSRFLADMELYIARFSFDYAISDRLNIGIDLPLQHAHNGILDSSIRQFHNAFNMPDGNRSLRPDNRFGYLLNAPGGWNSAPRWETGNIDLRLKFAAMHSSDLDIALLAAIKLPTASHSRGWSSGRSDVAAGIALSHEGDELFHHLNIWGVAPTIDNELSYRIKPYFRGSLTSGWKTGWLSEWLQTPIALLAQVQGGTSPYRTGLLQMDRPPWLISFGARFISASGRVWSMTFVENITQHSTQDFGVSLGVELHPYE